MSSIVNGYEYDVFISYRHNDNHSGWVTDFVAALKEELATTLKENVTVYFDTGTPDVLLESYNVDKSLENKLKCLIFIPIISQTYCDSKCFAWQNEFRVFNKIALEDSIGRDIRLASGNVTSRILPVRIHDLDQTDQSMLENELGGILRSIDFIYKSAGVNRPLGAKEDHPRDNLNKTYYRDQINKVANAIKEIIYALKYDEQTDSRSGVAAKPASNGNSVKTNPLAKRSKKLFRNILLSALFIIIIFIVIFFGYKRIIRPDRNNNVSELVLEKAINCCDFFHKWEDYHARVRLSSFFENGTHSDEIIEIQTGEGFYQSAYTSGNLNYIKGIKADSCYHEINGNKQPDDEQIIKYRLDCNRTRYMKEFTYCLFGLLMELKKEGMQLQKEVKTEKFNGSKCFTLTFLSDSSKVSNSYFKGLNYRIYLDPNDYSIKGLRWFGRLNAYIIYSGTIKINGIKVPLCRTVINSEDNSIQYIDIITFAD